jgi:subtilisin family serine protease
MKFIVSIILISFAISGFSQKPKNKRDREAEKRALAQHQVARMGADYFKQENLTGKGIRIAIFDGGFKDVDKHPAFEHIRENIVATYDFTNNTENVYRYKSWNNSLMYWHGTAVLSNIAGQMDSLPLGLAPDAEFLLARVGKRKPFSEKQMDWRRAIDWAYEHNAQIINMSLGLDGQYLFRENLDGQTNFLSKVAQYAAEKGVISKSCGVLF